MIMACCSAEAYDAVSCFVYILRQGCYRKAVSYPFYGKIPGSFSKFIFPVVLDFQLNRNLDIAACLFAEDVIALY